MVYEIFCIFAMNDNFLSGNDDLRRIMSFAYRKSFNTFSKRRLVKFIRAETAAAAAAVAAAAALKSGVIFKQK